MNQDRKPEDGEMCEMCDRARALAEKLLEVMSRECSEGPCTFNFSLGAMTITALTHAFNGQALESLGHARFHGLIGQAIEYGEHLVLKHRAEPPEPKGPLS